MSCTCSPHLTGAMLKGTGSWEWSPYSTGVEWSPVTTTKYCSALLVGALYKRLMSCPIMRSTASRNPTCTLACLVITSTAFQAVHSGVKSSIALHLFHKQKPATTLSLRLFLQVVKTSSSQDSDTRGAPSSSGRYNLRRQACNHLQMRQPVVAGVVDSFDMKKHQFKLLLDKRICSSLSAAGACQLS